jgi:hypothetical protein
MLILTSAFVKCRDIFLTHWAGKDGHWQGTSVTFSAVTVVCDVPLPEDLEASVQEVAFAKSSSLVLLQAQRLF